MASYISIINRIEPIDDTGITGNHLLSPEEEFKGHCSNLQVWVENDYDSKAWKVE